MTSSAPAGVCVVRGTRETAGRDYPTLGYRVRGICVC